MTKKSPEIAMSSLPSLDPVDQTFPEGGTRAWLTVCGATLMQFSTFGYTNAFGVYQGAQVSGQFSNSLLTSNGAIGWIGGLQVFLLFTCGIFTGRAFDRGYFHYLMIGGAFLQSLSLFMLSLSHQSKYYQVFLSQGIAGGLASGFVHIPSFGIVSHYFQHHRAFAMGIVSVGGALGALIHPIILNNLFHGPIGFHNGVRISAAMNTILMVIANLMMRPRLPPQKNGSTLPLRKFMHDAAYIACFLGTPLFICGLFFPVFYVQLDAVTHGIDSQLAFYLLSILNATSILGRIVPTFCTPKIGVFNTIIFFALSMAVLTYSLCAVTSSKGFIAFSAIFGVFMGGGSSLVPPMLGSLADDTSEIGARIGIVFAFGGVGGLVSTPIAGALLTSHFHWWRPVIFQGTVIVAGTVFFMVARFIITKRKGTQFV